MPINFPLLATSLVLSLTSLNAQAGLSAYVSDKQNVVYDNVTNITWTADANLLATLENTQGYNTVVQAIIANDPYIHETPNFFDNAGPGVYKLSSTDFNAGGKVDWWGAQAFISYLNSLNNGAGYAGSNHWALPSTPNSDASFGYNLSNSQLGELYYNELHGLAYVGHPTDYGILHDASYANSGSTGPFVNAESFYYWSGTEYAPAFSFYFSTYHGDQNYHLKQYMYDVWAVSPGQISAVPELSEFGMLISGLLALLGLKRRGMLG